MSLAIPGSSEEANRQHMRKKDKYAKLFGRDPLDALFVSTLEEWDDAKHRKACEEEIEMINAIRVTECPRCSGTSFKKASKSRPRGVQRYYCHHCRRYFTPLTGTLFDANKIPISERIEYILHLLRQHSTISSALGNVNAETTGSIWLFKVFLAIRGCQSDVVLKGDEVWYDEYYIPMARSKKGKKRDGTYKRGVSTDQLCVFTATDGEDCVFIVGGWGPPNGEKVLSFLSEHITEGATFHHDGDPCHNLAVAKFKLKSEVHIQDYEDGEPDLMEPINDMHSYFSRFLSQHLGFDRESSQDWANLFWVSMTFRPLELGARYIIERMIKTKIVVRYRDFYGKHKKKELLESLKRTFAK